MFTNIVKRKFPILIFKAKKNKTCNSDMSIKSVKHAYSQAYTYSDF